MRTLHIPFVRRNIFLNHTPTVLYFQPSSQRSSGSIGSCSLPPSVAKTLLFLPRFNEVCIAGLLHPIEAHPNASGCLHQKSWGKKIDFLLENASLQGFPLLGSRESLMVLLSNILVMQGCYANMLIYAGRKGRDAGTSVASEVSSNNYRNISYIWWKVSCKCGIITETFC